MDDSIRLTKDMPQYKAIKKAWIKIVGKDNFDKLNLNSMGFSDWRCRKLFSRDKDNLIYERFKYGSKRRVGEDLLYRPKSLKELENNNGWTKILSKDDLPQDNTFAYKVGTIHEVWSGVSFLTEVHAAYENGFITHFQKIPNFEKPFH